MNAQEKNAPLQEQITPEGFESKKVQPQYPQVPNNEADAPANEEPIVDHELYKEILPPDTRVIA
jgi:hypothetical protein